MRLRALWMLFKTWLAEARKQEERDSSLCGVTHTSQHSEECRYLGCDTWDCGKVDNWGAEQTTYDESKWSHTDDTE